MYSIFNWPTTVTRGNRDFSAAIVFGHRGNSQCNIFHMFLLLVFISFQFFYFPMGLLYIIDSIARTTLLYYVNFMFFINNIILYSSLLLFTLFI